MPQVTTETDVASLKCRRRAVGPRNDAGAKTRRASGSKSTEQGWYIDKSRFDFHINPVLNQSVGGPENFYMYQLGVMGSAGICG